jgi:hypothetical protein
VNDFDALEQFTIVAPAGEAKPGQELACDQCGEVVCDVEPGDSLAVLANTADAHWLEAGHEPDDVVPHCGVTWPNLGPAGGLWTCTLDVGHGGDNHEARRTGGHLVSDRSGVIPKGHSSIITAGDDDD